MSLEELHIAAEVGAEIAPRPEGDDERLQPPNDEGADEDDPAGPAGLRELRSAPGELQGGLAEGAHGETH